jgi:hypothetical protein
MGILPVVTVPRDVRPVFRSKKARSQRPLLHAIRINRGAENREGAKSAKTDAKKCGEVPPQMNADEHR